MSQTIRDLIPNNSKWNSFDRKISYRPKFSSAIQRRNYPVIYCGENYSLAMLEKLVHSNTGDIPEHQQWIEITIPVGTTYEIVTSYSLPDWKELALSKAFGDEWLESNRSCILIVPSTVAPVENNIIINEAHLQFSTIKTSLNRPVFWARRLFFSPQ